MRLSRVVLCVSAMIVFAGAALFAAGIASTNGEVTTPPVYVPDISHQSDPLTDSILAWDSASKETNVVADAETAHFVFRFTNVSTDSVTILDVHPSCGGCTTAELPPLPWTIAAGTNNQIGVTVNLAGKSGAFFKTVHIATDKGSRDLLVKITILPPAVPTMTDSDRANGVMAAKVDRQAVLRDDCATCHVKRGEGKYGKALYDADCAICHDAERRATMVPDLHKLKVPTNDAFWRTWIAHGKAGSLMPAFSTAEGGPLTDMQIASLAAYLGNTIESEPPPAN